MMQEADDAPDVRSERLKKEGYDTTEAVADANYKELAKKCGLADEDAISVINSARTELGLEPIGVGRIRNDGWGSLNAYLLVSDEISRHHDQLFNRQGAIIQPIGILLAFASIVLTVALGISSETFDGYVSLSYWACLISLGICCVIGIVSILLWRGWNHDSTYLIDLSNELDGHWMDIYDELPNKILNMIDEDAKRNELLSNFILTMSILLGTGLILLTYLELGL